jgi:hypothetical protein
MEVANTLAYYDTATVMDVKSFILHAPGGMCYNTFLLYYLSAVTLSLTTLTIMHFIVMLNVVASMYHRSLIS